MAASAQLSGLASEEAQTLRFTAEALDLRGLLIAGIVVGALGVLDDVTVSQVSTVAALRRAQPETGLAAVILTHTAELPEDDGHGHHHGHVRHPAPHLDQGWPSPTPRRDRPDDPWF